MERSKNDQIFQGILSVPAYERLGRLKLYNPQLYKKIESRLISLYGSGQIKQQIDEERFKEIVKEFQEEKKSFTVVRRHDFGDLDDI